MCEFKDRKHKSPTTDPSVNDEKEAGMADGEERLDCNSKRNTLFCQHDTKQLLCRIREKSIKKHYIKYYPFLS